MLDFDHFMVEWKFWSLKINEQLFNKYLSIGPYCLLSRKLDQILILIGQLPFYIFMLLSMKLSFQAFHDLFVMFFKYIFQEVLWTLWVPSPDWLWHFTTLILGVGFMLLLDDFHLWKLWILSCSLLLSTKTQRTIWKSLVVAVYWYFYWIYITSFPTQNQGQQSKLFPQGVKSCKGHCLCLFPSCWSGHVSLSLWSNDFNLTSLYDHSLRLFS